MAAPMRIFASARFAVFGARSALQRSSSLAECITVNGTQRRYLFSDEILGIEGYKKHRTYTLERMGSMKDAFRTKMEQYLASQDKDTVFSDDLKTLLSIAETDEDIETAIKMLRKYTEQQSLRFNSFQFGPVVMRMLHSLKRPDKAMEIFKDKDFSTMFDHVSSCLTLMDNLFVNGCHDDVINVFPEICEKFKDSERFPRDCITIYVASSWQKDTPEQYSEMLEVLKSLRTTIQIPDKAYSMAAFFAILQKDAKTAMELVSSVGRDMSVGPMNVKAMAFAELDRPEDSLSLVTSVLYRDIPSHFTVRQDIFPDTMETIHAAVQRLDKSELTNKYEIVRNDLTKTGHMSRHTLSHYLLQPVVRNKTMKAGFKSRERSSPGEYIRSGNTVRPRSSLLDE